MSLSGCLQHSLLVKIFFEELLLISLSFVHLLAFSRAEVIDV